MKTHFNTNRGRSFRNLARLPLFFLFALVGPALSIADDRPNILWISSEDHGPHLGCYGDSYATTPNLDAFASQSLLYTQASSNAPVCAPARTTIISGMYPTSLGAHNMRSRVPSPDYLRFFPNYLKDAGYYTTNNSKEDYNLLTDSKGWDDSSTEAHWKNRPDPDQPFFAIFNFTRTHESQIRNENDNPQHDPRDAPLPPYHPDTPEVRKDWAQYYDRLTLLDDYFQERLDELEEAGLAEDTIVIFWADHGSGMPRSKRYPGWSGLHVPLIVYVPERFQNLAPKDYAPGAKSDRLVGFVDFAPTTLSLAGIKPASYHQGAAFLGEFIAQKPKHSFGFRGRMDERPDEIRSATDGQYIYIRNYLPHLPHGQYIHYQQITPTTNVWYQLFNDGKLNAEQSAFWQPHPAEELYDLSADPYETKNLAKDPKHQSAIKSFRKALSSQQARIKDLYFIPEPIIRQAILDDESPTTYFSELTAHYPKGYGANPEKFPRQKLTAGNKSKDPAVKELSDTLERYWKLIPFLSTRKSEVADNIDELLEASKSDEAIIAVTACEALALYAKDEKIREQALETLVELARYPENELILSVQALNALDHAKEHGATLPPDAAELTGQDDSIPGWASSYRARVVERL